jgi:hypothetical protein
VIAQRALAVAAAVFFVAAVALATFGSQSMSLGQTLFLFDASLLNKLLTWSNHVLGDWVWTSVMQPLLVRPAWLLPASAGIICGGLSLSLSNRKSPHRSHRRS